MREMRRKKLDNLLEGKVYFVLEGVQAYGFFFQLVSVKEDRVSNCLLLRLKFYCCEQST